MSVRFRVDRFVSIIQAMGINLGANVSCKDLKDLPPLECKQRPPCNLPCDDDELASGHNLEEQPVDFTFDGSPTTTQRAASSVRDDSKVISDSDHRWNDAPEYSFFHLQNTPRIEGRGDSTLPQESQYAVIATVPGSSSIWAQSHEPPANGISHINWEGSAKMDFRGSWEWVHLFVQGRLLQVSDQAQGIKNQDRKPVFWADLLDLQGVRHDAVLSGPDSSHELTLSMHKGKKIKIRLRTREEAIAWQTRLQNLISGHEMFQKRRQVLRMLWLHRVRGAAMASLMGRMPCEDSVITLRASKALFQLCNAKSDEKDQYISLEVFQSLIQELFQMRRDHLLKVANEYNQQLNGRGASIEDGNSACLRWRRDAECLLRGYKQDLEPEQLRKFTAALLESLEVRKEGFVSLRQFVRLAPSFFRAEDLVLEARLLGVVR